MDNMIIVSNQAECLLCGDTPFSAHRHDYKSCKCGALSVDGGDSYIRRVADSFDEVREMTLQYKEDFVDQMISSIGSSEKAGKNDRGYVYDLLRVIRDAGYEIVEKDNGA